MIDRVVELRGVFCVHRTGEGDAAALQGIQLEHERGEVLCVLGPSGAGKSTLLRVIAGLQTPSAGVVNVLGCDVGRISARARARFRHEQLGFLGQRADAVLAPELPVREAVALPLALRGVAPRARARRAEELAEQAGIADRGALPGELSGGERQRVALCAALAHRPALLLADEPTGELDEVSAASIRGLIVELAHAADASVIVVSHDPAMSTIADRAVRIRDGRVVEDQRDGERALVVDRDGWVQIPSDLLARVGITTRARAAHADGGVMLTPAGREPVTPADTGAPAFTGRRRPARVKATALTRSYTPGRRVIDELSHDFALGRLTVLTGPSGTGKTTLLRLLAGLDRPDGGQIEIDGEPLRGRDEEQRAALRRERIGYLPQEPAPVGFLSALENVVLALRIRGWSATAAAERAAVALARVGLTERARQRVHRLSAGEAQRVALARALASARGLLIVDEPTSRLDEAHAAGVAEMLIDAATEDGQTVICATHDPSVIRRGQEVLALTGPGARASGADARG